MFFFISRKVAGAVKVVAVAAAVVALAGLVFSCGKPLPELSNIDLSVWRSDRNGCKGKRAPMIAAIQSQQEKLLALKEMQIVELFGRPDKNELYKGNQKFYYYSLNPSPACGDSASAKLELVIRFNAMGLAKEVSVE